MNNSSIGWNIVKWSPHQREEFVLSNGSQLNLMTMNRSNLQSGTETILLSTRLFPHSERRLTCLDWSCNQLTMPNTIVYGTASGNVNLLNWNTNSNIYNSNSGNSSGAGSGNSNTNTFEIEEEAVHVPIKGGNRLCTDVAWNPSPIGKL